VATIIGVSLFSGVSGGKQEAEKEELSDSIEESKQNIEKIDETQEAAEEVKNLTTEYKDLIATGESAYDTMKQMEEAIPNLIDKYKELEKAVDIDLNVGELEAAYEYFKKTGDISKFEELQKENDVKVAEAELEENEKLAQDSTRLAVMTAGDGNRN